MSDKTFTLITGGAGYIGSHLARQCGEAGEQLIILDNLSTGSQRSLSYGNFIQADIGDRHTLQLLFKLYPIKTLIHLAASTEVHESLRQPLAYYQNNISQMITLLDVAKDHVDQVIFSSSAAVYGIPTGDRVTEDSPTQPINPYGRTKLMGEQILQDVAASKRFKTVILRFFNVAGADLQGRMGPWRAQSQVVDKAVTAKLSQQRFEIFGHDFATDDGTAVRDFIHVEDIASAHIAAMRYLQQGGASTILNVGNAQGYSVKQVVDAVNQLSPSPLKTHLAAKRAGDPAHVIADNHKIINTLNWQPKYHDLSTMVESAYRWREANEL